MTFPEAHAAHDAARRMLNSDLDPAHARTVARLLRHAVERAVDAFWDTARPGEVTDRRRARRIRLVRAYDADIARHAYATWCMLSDAARPHLYEMAPAEHELHALQSHTSRLLTALADLAAQHPAPSQANAV